MAWIRPGERAHENNLTEKTASRCAAHSRSRFRTAGRVVSPVARCRAAAMARAQGGLFYPTVRKVDGSAHVVRFVLESAGSAETALGFAVSRDGRHWAKSPHNPSCGPIPNGPGSRTSDQPSLARLEDGSWRIWYATARDRRSSQAFAIGTAKWSGPMR